MSIPMNNTCVSCFMGKRLAQISQLGTEVQATELGKKILQMYAQSPADMDSALLGGLVDAEIYKYFGIDPDRFKTEKELSNQFVLERLESIRSRVQVSDDPIYAGLQYAVLGNYLDFSALAGQVSFDDLDKMLDQAKQIDLDKEVYGAFCADLEKGGKFLYITDNAGEIGFDRVLAEELAKAYPQLQITFMVRGGVIANDATRADAKAVGITFPVMDSGVAIGGTAISYCSPAAQAAIREADVILAKGMGNTESMYGCGYNVYYAFLVKCDRFIEFFNKPKMTPMFIRDK